MNTMQKHIKIATVQFAAAKETSTRLAIASRVISITENNQELYNQLLDCVKQAQPDYVQGVTLLRAIGMIICLESSL